MKNSIRPDPMAKVLIVEDSPTISAVYQALFKNEGYQVLNADDGINGFNSAKKEKPDLIVLDLMLPGMDGLKICAMLKKDHRFKHIKIILLTEKVTERELGKEAGADEHFTKDCDPAQVLETAKRLLSR